MDINSLVAREENAGEGGGEGYSELKDNLYKLPENSETIVKFKPDGFFPSYEAWIKPSDNLPPERDPEKTQFAFRLKNGETHNLLAEIFGGAERWDINPKKRQVNYGQYKGGLYEFEYTDQKNKDGFAIKRYKYLHNPEYREFFQNFAFKGEMYDMDSNPKVTPGLKYYTHLFIPEDPYCKEKQSWRHTHLSYKSITQLIDFQKNGFPLEDTWFKIKREGSGLQTKYSIIPLAPKINTDYAQAYNLSELNCPDLNLATKLSSNSYCWKYLQSYIVQADKILGTNYAEKMKRDYDERQASEPAQSGNSAPRAVPSAVKEAATTTAPAASSAAIDYNMSDDDIPF